MAMLVEQECDLDYYKLLNLPTSNEKLDGNVIKAAYRRTLLLHHPDKSSHFETSKSRLTIDQITKAYKTLSNPTARSNYDRQRASAISKKSTLHTPHHPGFETVDLDDLCYDEGSVVWYRGCRCGKDKAFVITEEQLEAHADDGEIVTGCQGCSLWLRVTFAVAEEND